MTTGHYSANYHQIDSYGTDTSWMNTNHATMGYADQVRRFTDSDEYENPILQHLQGYGTGGGYVLKTERVVEHVTRAPVVSIMMTKYRPYGSPDHEKAEKFIRDYGAERRFTRPGAIHDPPVQNFLAKIQTEASQPITKVSAPFIRPNWRAHPISSGRQDADHYKNGKTKYDSDDDYDKDFIKDIHHGTKANPVSATNKYNLYERPNEGPVMQNHTPVSRPINDINDGVEILTGGIRNIQPDVNRPSRAGNFGLGRWRNGYRMDSDSGDSDSVKEQKTHGMNNKDYEMPEGNHKSVSKPFGKANSFPLASHHQQQQQPRFSVPQNQLNEVNSYSESIDSSEARKKYGKLKPQAGPIDPKAGTISSEDLIKKYNGAKVPW
ncbi:OLC1v1000698C1 [Oldenlandia corymbosa var. corymbosa]|uniref:OLC1v1000698C1 n=1 Tax=Oldenlandia corymbosa var. corymbosa TaxID=529605 RepID=A0AAV1D707_OLDCO|nr:OLC1v1000698C1 [Oldenlandia corymbosa var. corymbosa]